jgi:hypothetical protein
VVLGEAQVDRNQIKTSANDSLNMTTDPKTYFSVLPNLSGVYI